MNALFLLVYEIILFPLFFLFLIFFFFILNKTTSYKSKMSFPSESDMMSKELQNSDLIYVNLRTDVFKIIVKYRWKIIAKYRHLSPSGNRALMISSVNVTKSAVSCGFGHIYWRNPYWKTLFVQWYFHPLWLILLLICNNIQLRVRYAQRYSQNIQNYYN